MYYKINGVLGYDQRKAGKHFFPGTGKFMDWHKLKKLPKIDSVGKDLFSSQSFSKMYKEDIKNKLWKETPYLDFWHFQIENCFNDDFRNDSYGTVNIGMEIVEDAEPWQKEIQKVWNNTFKELADKNDIVDVWISW